MFLHSRCAGCGVRGAAQCRTCRFALVARTASDGPDGVVAACAYTGRVRDILLGLKYQNRRAVGAHLGGVVVRRLVESLGADAVDAIDAVTWAPTSGARRRRRGFDQAELIARAVAARIGVPCRRLLEREPSAAAQTGLGRRDRLDPQRRPRFRAHPRHVAGATVLVVDDVVTTGATLDASAAALQAAGAARTLTAAVAATPACLRPIQQVA
jgi:predicted amidophosphoribosyltransferase